MSKRFLLIMAAAAVAIAVFACLALGGCTAGNGAEDGTLSTQKTAPDADGTGTDAPDMTGTAALDTDARTEPDTGAPDVTETDTETDTVTDTETETETDAPEPGTLSLTDWFYGNDIEVTPVVTKERPVDRITVLGRDITSGNFAIVIADGADEKYVEAANLLREKFSGAVGADLPVIRDGEGSADCEIVVGTTDRDTDAVRSRRDALTGEGYLLLTEGNRLYISGQDGRTTVNGVLSFLEDYIGCRFFATDCQPIHEAGDITVPEHLDVSFNPVFEYRCSYYQFVDESPAYNTIYKQHPLVYPCGRVHTLRDLADMQNYQTGDQPCLTDPAIYDRVMKKIRAYLRQHPEATVVSVSQNDSFEGQLGCQCENCRALNEKYGCDGGSLFDFVNRVARDIAETNPGVRIETLAYHYTVKPPKDMVFEDNVLVMLCTSKLCVNHAIDDPTCEANYRYAEYLEDWSKVCSHISVWDYHTTFSDYQIPFPNENMLYDQITYYAAHNVVSLFSEGNYNSRSGQFEELRAYICSRLMWNIQETKDEYLESIDDFLKYYYGDGWQYIKRYMDIIEYYARQDGRHFDLHADARTAVPFRAKSEESKIFDEAFVGLFDKALAAAGSDAQRAHIRKASIQVYHYIALTARKSGASAYKNTYDDLMEEFGIALQNEVTPFTR